MVTNSHLAGSGQLPSRQLWQVPVFLFGFITLGGFFLARPLWNNPQTRAEARLNEARRLWEHGDAPPDKVLDLTKYYLVHVGEQAARAAEAHFITGSTLVRRARGTNADADLLTWQQAHQHLIQARDLGLSEEDGLRMRAALGECGYYTNDDLPSVCSRLSHNLEGADDKTDACRILTLACLKKQPPDLEGALQANGWLRQQPLLGEDVLGPARLDGGEILMRLHRPADARKLLEKIAHDARPEVLARSRILRARSLQDENQWTTALTLWQEALADKQPPPADPGDILYNLGLCHRRLEQRDEALGAWRDGVKRGRLDAAVACSFGVGELLLASADAGAVDALVWTVRDVRSSETWTNTYVALKQARDLFEQGCLVFRQKRDYEKSLALAEAYERLATPGTASYQRGLSLREWGQSLVQGTPAERTRSVDLLKQAGQAFEQAAEASKELPERAERLWLSSAGHLDGGDPERAVRVLERFLQLDGHTPERFGEAWYWLAIAQERLKHRADAEASYQCCKRYRSRFGCRARFRLSEMELARGHVDVAVGWLEENLKALQTDADDEAKEKSLFSLGHLLFVKRDYPSARPMLEQGVSDYPNSTACVRGRFELAETYRQLAIESQNFMQDDSKLSPETREHFLEQRRKWLTQAADQYELLSQALTNKTLAAALTAVEQVQVVFSMADCRFNLGEYAAALKLYDDLADRYKGRLEYLSALGGTARCFAAQRDFPRFRARLADIRVALKSADPRTQREWEQWLSVAGKGQ